MPAISFITLSRHIIEREKKRLKEKPETESKEFRYSPGIASHEAARFHRQRRRR